MACSNSSSSSSTATTAAPIAATIPPATAAAVTTSAAVTIPTPVAATTPTCRIHKIWVLDSGLYLIDGAVCWRSWQRHPHRCCRQPWLQRQLAAEQLFLVRRERRKACNAINSVQRPRIASSDLDKEDAARRVGPIPITAVDCSHVVKGRAAGSAGQRHAVCHV